MNKSQVVVRKIEKLSSSCISDENCGFLVQIIDTYTNVSTIRAAHEYSSELLNAPKTIEIAGRTMKWKPSSALANLCEYYLKSSPCENLRWVIEAVFSTRVRPRLYKLVAERLEEDSKNSVWNIVLSTTARNERIEALTHRFFELGNEFDELAVFYVSYFTRNSKTIELLFEWQKRNHANVSDSTSTILFNLLRHSYKYNKTHHPKIVKYARRWVRTYPNSYYCSLVHSALIRTNHSEYDCKHAKSWYQKCKKTRKWGVLLALQEHALKENNKSDEFAISELKHIVISSRPEKLHPNLIGGLLKHCRDIKVVEIAMEVYFKSKRKFLLYDLMKYAPDKELLQHAKRENKKFYSKHRYYSSFYSCIILEAEPQAKNSIKMAKNSLRDDNDDFYSKKLRKLLKKIET